MRPTERAVVCVRASVSGCQPCLRRLNRQAGSATGACRTDWCATATAGGTWPFTGSTPPTTTHRRVLGCRIVVCVLALVVFVLDVVGQQVTYRRATGMKAVTYRSVWQIKKTRCTWENDRATAGEHRRGGSGQPPLSSSASTLSSSQPFTPSYWTRDERPAPVGVLARCNLLPKHGAERERATRCTTAASMAATAATPSLAPFRTPTRTSQTTDQ